MGNLRGIQITPELCSVIKAVLALPQVTTPEEEEAKKRSSDEKSSSLPPSSSNPAASLARAQEAKTQLSSVMTVKASKSILQNAINDAAVDAALPLAGVIALQSLILMTTDEDAKTQQKLSQELETALHQTKQLSFHKQSSQNSNNSDPKFQKRLERLRLQNEERSYLNLTTNLKTAASLKDDNVTVKSMTYAASVGLNMIVAPISFGVFMYFFAGSIFNRFFGSDNDDKDNNGDIDIKRVIAGVVSGVFMLFVEMILFVIRSHELDASVRKKSKRRENRANPFGYTQKSMERVYVRDD
jgi:hypothetical protein